MGLPKAVARGIAGLAEASYQALKMLLGLFGVAAFWVLRILAAIIMSLPVQILRIAEVFGRSIAERFKEVIVWYDPK